MRRWAVFAFLLLGLAAVPLGAAEQPDPVIWAEIQRTRAIDHHAHPVKVVRPGEKEDTDYDALPADAMQPFDAPPHLRPDNPHYVQAWRALYGYPYRDMSPARLKALAALKQRFKTQKGDAYSGWVLDKLGIQVMFANRVAMGRGLTPKRFRWVPFDDALLFPLDNSAGKRISPEHRSMYTGEEQLLQKYLKALKLGALPPTLDGYVEQVVLPTLQRQRKGGAVAVKFEAAYLRSLEFAEAPEAEARATYARYLAGGEPPVADYKVLQDYLFRRLAREAGRLGMPLHFHMGLGVGRYFRVSGANPLLLEALVNDPALAKTKFVMVHGGWPFIGESASLLAKPNVYADFSGQTYLFTPETLAKHLRTYLEIAPEKLMFGTDAFTLSPAVDWEEVGWLSSTVGRRGLALALSGMVRDGEITRARALEIARGVLRGNAIRLYKLQVADGR